MAESPQSVRIFISSPGDVAEERDQARRVIEGLQKHYSGVTLQPVLWEDLALPATASFQESIDFILEREPIDIAVFILWSRLGTPLGVATTRPDGTPYRSGTEREFDLMLAAFEQSGRKRPVILAYARDDTSGFQQKLSESPESELEQLIAQRKLTKAFIREQFHDVEGHNLRAYQTYREPAGFAQRLRVHLRQTLDGVLQSETGTRWDGEPYRGLQVFDVEHAPIFHGREEETCELLQRLRDQERAGCAFVVIVGASGSGKSSLARAGVAATLKAHAGDDGVRQWRTAFLTPSLETGSLCSGLARTLAEALPELGDSGVDRDKVAGGLAKDPALTVELSIAPVFARVGSPATPDTGDSPPDSRIRVLLVLDQMEELWTDRCITDDDRQRFLKAIEALASSSHVAVLGTLRSDFYPQAQQMPEFLRLKGERGHYDLLPPTATAIGRLITEPARLAGLRFERDEEAGRSLDEVIANDAARNPGALPLLQYALDELHRQQDENSRLLTFTAYERLGGVEGALGQRAEEIFSALPPEAQDAFSEIMPLLVTVDATGDFTAVRRRAPLSELTATPTREALTTGLIEARLLTTGRTGHDYVHARVDVDIGTVPVGDVPIASLAHETLLSHWKRLAGWVTQNREHLRLRTRVEQNQRRWEQHGRDASLLLPPGLPLEEGRQLLGQAPHLLDSNTRHYLRASIDYEKRLADESRRRRRVVTTVLSVLTIAATIGGLLAWINKAEADRQREIADAKADDAERNLDRAQRAAFSVQLTRVAELVRQQRFNAALDLLNDETLCPPHLADFSSNFYSHLCEQRRADTKLVLHSAGVNSIDLSGDSSLIASGSDDHTIVLWDRTKRKLIRRLEGHADEVLWVDFSSDDSKLASASRDGTVRIWNVHDLLEPVTIDAHDGPVQCVTFSPDDRLLATAGNDSTTRLWDAESHKLMHEFQHRAKVWCAQFSPDGTRLVAGCDDGSISLWDLKAYAVVADFTPHGSSETGVPGLGVKAVRFAPHIPVLVSADVGGHIKVWGIGDIEGTDDEIRPLTEFFGHRAHVNAVTFSPDDQFIASAADDGTIKVWDILNGKPVAELQGHDGPVWDLAFDASSSSLISAGNDHSIRFWTTRPDYSSREVTLPRDATGPVALNDDRVLYASESGTIQSFDLVTGGLEIVAEVSQDINIVQLSAVSDGETLAVADGQGDAVQVFQESGRKSQRLQVGVGAFPRILLDPAGSRLFVTGATCSIVAWRFDDQSEKLARNCDEPIQDFCLSPDGEWLATVSDGPFLRVYDAETLEILHTISAQDDVSLNCVAFSTRGSLIAAGASAGEVFVFHTSSGDPAYSIHAHTEPGIMGVGHLTWSPDGRTMATAGRAGAVKLWDTTSGDFRGSLLGHQAPVAVLLFHSEKQQLMSLDVDGVLRNWVSARGKW